MFDKKALAVLQAMRPRRNGRRSRATKIFVCHMGEDYAASIAPHVKMSVIGNTYDAYEFILKYPAYRFWKLYSEMPNRRDTHALPSPLD
jgi:hypothetical protein